MVVFWPKKNVTISIVCPLQIHERILSLVQFNDCSLEQAIIYENRPDIYTISGVTGSPAHMSSLMKALEDLEWDTPDKIYIFIGAKKKNGGKKNGKTAGTEVHAGSEGGNPEGADRAAEYGEAPGVDGDCDSCGDPDLSWLEGIS